MDAYNLKDDSLGYDPNAVKSGNPYSAKTLVFQLGCKEYKVGNRYMVTFSNGNKALAEYLGTSPVGIHRWRAMGNVLEDTPRFVCYQKELFTCRDAEDAAMVYSICRMFDDPSFEIKLIHNLIKNFDVVDDPTLMDDIPKIIEELQDRLKGHMPIKTEDENKGVPINIARYTRANCPQTEPCDGDCSVCQVEIK